MGDLFERSSAELHRGMIAGLFKSLDLLAHYEERIAALDPRLSSMTMVNPMARAAASPQVLPRSRSAPMTVAAIGRPAGHTGLVGLKPTIGRVQPARSLRQILLDLEVSAPIARTVEALALVHEGIASPIRAIHDRQRAHGRGGGVTDPLRRSVRRPAVRRWHPRVRRRCGAQVRGPWPSGQDRAPAARDWSAERDLAWLVQTLGRAFVQAATAHLVMASNGTAIGAVFHLGLLNRLRAWRGAAGELFAGRLDFIHTPRAAAQPWPTGEALPPVIDGRPVGPRGHAVYNRWVDAIGHPAIALPAGQHADGLPVGFQLVGGFGCKRQLFALAARFEAEARWAGQWPAIARTSA